MNFGFVINALGRIAIVVALFMATSLIWVAYYSEYGVLDSLLLSVAISLLLGIAMVFGTQNRNKNVNMKDRYIIVTVSWFFIGILGAMPYYLSGYIPNIIDAIFESISGFTTTGSSILTDIESLPLSILYWRSLTHWIGGMGIIVLVIAIFPLFKTTGYQMFSLEASGLLNQKIKPRTSDIAKRMWGIYVSLTIILVALLMFGGVNFYESLCHAFGTVATGGFSTKNASVGHYSSYVQYTIIMFMFLSGMNFTLHYFLIKGSFEKLWQNSEFKAYVGIILTISSIIAAILIFDQHYETEIAIRDSLFQVVSVITATGFATTDYLQWPVYAWILIFFLMFIGACVGSTGGGIKVIRHVVAFKLLKKRVSLLFHPKGIKTIRVSKHSITDNQAVSIITFILAYLLIFIAGFIILSLMGIDLQTSMGSVITSMGGIGPGLGTVGPAANFAHIPDAGKVTLFILMIVGRLEIFTVIILFLPEFWQQKESFSSEEINIS
jgi:trk system potassium uptake protein TrkH